MATGAGLSLDHQGDRQYVTLHSLPFSLEAGYSLFLSIHFLLLPLIQVIPIPIWLDPWSLETTFPSLLLQHFA